MRKVAIAILSIVVLIIIAALVIPSFLDVNQYRGKIQAELEQRLGRQVSLGTMHLRLLPLSFRVDNVSIGEDARFRSGQPFAQAQEVDITVKVLPLLHKDVEISSLELQRPHIELIRDASGTWNFSSLGHPQPAGAPQPTSSKAKPAPAQAPAPASQKSQQQQQFELGTLQITDGQIALTDQQKHQSRAVYDHIDLTLKNYAPRQPFSLDMAAHLPGKGTQLLRLKAKAGPIDEQDMLNTPLDGTVNMQQVSISAIQKFLNTQALAQMEASISGDAKVRNQAGKLASNGNLKLQDAVIRGNRIDYPITADYDVTDDLTNDVIHVAKANVRLGSTPLSITGDVNTRPTPSQLNLNLKASDVSISEAARLASAFGVAFAPGMTINGKLNADVHAQGAATQPAMNGNLEVRDLTAKGKDLPAPVNVKEVALALTPQAIRSNQFTANTGSTNLAIQFALSQYTSPSPSVDATLRTAGAKIDELINMAKAYGVSAVEGMSGSGMLNLDVHATGPLKNSSAMNFSGTGQVQNASLRMPSLTKPLGVRNANLRFTQNSVVLENLVASLGQTNATGNLTMHNFSAPQVQFALSADKLDVAELQQITSPAPAPAKRASNQGWDVVPAAHAATPPPSMLSIMTGSGTLSVGSILYDQLVLNTVKSNVNLDHGIIKLAPLTSQIYGGQQSGAITVDARRTPMAFNVSTKLDHVDANKLISSVSSIKNTLYGLLAANGQTSFNAVSSNDIARTLNGNMSLNLNNGKIMGVDLLNQLADIGKFLAGRRPAAAFTNIAKLSGTFNIRNGVAQTNDLKADIEGGNLAADGLVGLADQTLNMHLTAVLSNKFSQQVGGTGIGGMMNTALANNKGELVIPVIVTGSFSHPMFAPDLQKIAQMKLQHLLPSTSNPGALTSGILGGLLGGQGAQGQKGIGGVLGALSGQQQQQQQQPQQQKNAQQPQQQQQPSNPIGDILNQVMQNKKKQQQPQPPPK